MRRKQKTKRIEWIFFDVGDVLVNEDRLRFNLFRILERYMRANAVDLTFREILACREDLILDRADESPHYTMAKAYLPRSVYHRWGREVKNYVHKHLIRDLIVVTGMDRVIKRLSRTYSLGLIADQPRGILDFLKRKKLLSYFKVLAISGRLRMNKPSKEIFEWAVNRAGCTFSESVVVGDRLDRDIRPAKGLDMRTVQVRWNAYRKGFTPKTKKQIEYLRSLDRVRNWPPDIGDAVRADAITDRVSELPEIIHQLACL